MVRTSASSSATTTRGRSLLDSGAGTPLTDVPAPSFRSNCRLDAVCGQWLVVSRFSVVDDVGYPVTSRGHFACNEPAVTAKPHDLGAHDGRRRLVDELLEPRNSFRKSRRRHVDLVTPPPKPAQALAFPEIRDPSRRQVSLQNLFVDLGVPPRPRKVTNIDQLADAMFLEECNELVQRARG